MMEEKAQDSIFSQKINALFISVFQVFFGLCVVISIHASFNLEPSWSGFEKVLGLPILFVAFFVSVAIHEFGHFIAAKLLGFTVTDVQVRSMHFRAKSKGWDFLRVGISGEYGGFVSAFPKDRSGFTWKFIVFCAAGSIMNLLCAYLFWVHFDGYSDTVDALAVMLVMLGLGMAVGSLIPHKRQLASDGYLILHAFKNRKSLTPEYSLLILNGLAVRGTTADQLPLDLLGKLREGGDEYKLTLIWFEVKSAQNRNQIQEVQEVSQRFYEFIETSKVDSFISNKDFLQIIAAEISFCLAWLNKDKSLIRDITLGSAVDFTAPWLHYRIAALRFLLNGRTEEAIAALDKALNLADKCIDKALHCSERRIHAALKEDFKAHQTDKLISKAGAET